MKSCTLPSFWAAYKRLPESIKRGARKSYRVWAQNPFHPSLHFKCISEQEHIWSVRTTKGVRAVGIFENDVVTWFWIGRHDEYERFCS